MAASAILLVDVAYDGLAALELSQRHPHELTLLDKIQSMNAVRLYGHLERVQADTIGVLVKAFTTGTVHVASRAGIRQLLSKPAEFGRRIPLITEAAGTP
jgi:hypothetical protein